MHVGLAFDTSFSRKRKGRKEMNLDKLKGKLVENKKTYADASQFLGVSITTFTKKMNHQTAFTVIEAKALCEFLGLNDEEFKIIFLD